MITMEQAAGGINYCSGNLTLSIDLLDHPGQRAQNVRLPVTYNSAVLQAATTWNMTAPTGPLGLGWHLGFDIILAAREDDASPSNTQYYLLAADNMTPLVCTGASGDLLTYAAQTYAFWTITYNPARETWRIVKEDGISYYFGDSSSGRNTVQWSIAWDTWLGASIQTAGQSPVASAWNLSQVVDLWGQTTTYAYDSVYQYVGPAPGKSQVRPAFTQASYLSTITGITGETAILRYGEKVPDEYQGPHTSPPPPNAYQDRLQTRFLSSVDYVSAGGQTLFTCKLIYTDAQGGTAFLGSGNLTKRLLTGIERQQPGSQALPGLRFTYYGQQPADGVSPSTPYDASTHALYGAMKTATLPEGGTATYHYGKYDLGLSNRQTTVSMPAKEGYVFSLPRFSFADSYTVVTWYGEQTGGLNPIMQVTAYTWDGRWLGVILDAVPVSNAAAYNQIPIVMQDNFFGLASGQRIYLYYRDLSRAGRWVSPVVGDAKVPYFTTTIPVAEATQFASGDRFAAVLGTAGGELDRYHWNGQAWLADAKITLTTGSTVGSPSLFALAASSGYLLTTASATSGDNALTATLFYLDRLGAWQYNTLTSTRGVANLDKLILQAGQDFVVQTETDSLPSSTLAQYRVFRWNKSATSLVESNLGSFTFPGQQAPYQPVLHGSAVALGQLLYRYNGVTWLAQNLNRVAFPAGATLSSVSYAVDQVLRAIKTGPNAYTYDLVSYDPNTQAWSVPPGLSATGATPQVAASVARTTNQASNFIIFNSKIYYHSPDNTWSSGFTLPDTLSGDDLSSLQLVGSGYLIYQVAGNTKVFALQNGGVANSGAPITLSNQKVLVSPSMPGSLVGSIAFATYTGSYGTPASQLTLYRVVNEQAAGAQTGYCITGVLTNNGYQTVTTGYSYNATNATSDATGTIPYFNQVTLIPGSENPITSTFGKTENYFFNGLTADETPVVPYPVDASNTNAGNYYSRLKGTLYINRVKDSSGTLKSSTDYYWMVYSKTLGQNGVGSYSRLTKEVPMLDGVIGENINTYSPDTGLATRTSSRNYNSEGIEELVITEYKYFWEAYDPTRRLNLLLPVVERTNSTEQPAHAVNTITGISVTTWKSAWGYGPDTWAPWQTFCALDATASFTAWNGGPVDSHWLLMATAASRAATGAITLMTDVDGVATSFVLDNSQWYAVAQFANANAAAGEASYFGFEPYESLQGWGWTDSGSTLTENISTIDYHVGTRCLQLKPQPGQQVGPINVFQPSDQTRPYLFSCWAKLEPGFDPAQGVARWQIAVYRRDNSQQVGSTLNLDIPTTNNKWVYLQKTIDFPALRTGIPANTSLYAVISAFNQNSAKYCLLDALRFTAVNANFGAVVYQPDNWLVSATVGNNGEVNRMIYDGQMRMFAQVGPAEKVKWLIEPSYSRGLTAADVFLPAFPNSVLNVQTTSDSAYYDFHDGSTSDWAFTGGTWAIGGGNLSFTPSIPAPIDPLGGTATLQVFAFTNFAVRATCTPQANSNAGIGNGDVFVYWNAGQSKWVLARRQNDGTLTTELENNVLGFGKSWVLAIVEGFVLFYVDGRQLFGYTYIANKSLANIGKPVLALTGAGYFDDLLVFNNPQLGVSFQDGAGDPLQAIGYMGAVTGKGPNPLAYIANGQGVFTDSLGRPTYDRNALNAPLQLALPPGAGNGPTAATLLEGDQGTYLVDKDGAPVSVQAYINGADGLYDYTTSHYEDSPLSRLVAVVLPRETSAVVADFTVSYAYLTNTAAGPGAVMSDLLPPGSDNRYYLRQVTDQNGVKHYSLIDQAGRVVAQRTALADGTFNTTLFSYDPAGRLRRSNQPNYYAPPGGSQPTDWQESLTLNFLGRLVSRATPDTHTTQYVYDNAGRLRFQVGAEGAAQNPQRIRYFKYDPLSRLVERGYIQDASYAWGSPELSGKANIPAFPNVEDAGNNQYAAGSWYQKNTYDASPAQSDLPNLLGRLFQTRTNRANPGIETETFSYDEEGRVVAHTSQIANFDSGVYTTNYTYNNLDNVTSIVYPRLSGGPEFKVGYYYDRLGRVASVGDTVAGNVVVDPARPADAGEKYYSAYTYDELGNVLTESLNNGRGNPPGIANPNSFTRTYSYTPQGWLSELEDPYLRESLNYYEGAGTKYYNGNIAGLGMTFKAEHYPNPPEDYAYTFNYDNLNRLLKAQNNLNDAWTETLGPGHEPAYDPNGNIVNLQQGATKTTYHYAPSGQNQANNQLSYLSSTASSTLSLDTAVASPACASGWCWGANNGGPSSSQVVNDTQNGKVLMLGGGSLGHYEYLRLQTYLDPAGTYSLTFQVKTVSGFAGATGQAGWLVRFYTPEGEIVANMVSRITDTSGAWAAQSITINIPTLIASLGLNEEVTHVTLECVNYLRPQAGGGAGPVVYLYAPSVSAQAPVNTAVYGFDRDGNIVSAPAQALATLAYNPATNLTDKIVLADDSNVIFAQNGADLRGLELHRDSQNTTLGTVRTFRSLNGQPVMRVDTVGHASQTVLYIQGPTGVFASQQDGATTYFLRDHLGSPRALVAGASGAVNASFDYLPFGGLMRNVDGVDAAYRYTGQELDQETGLYNYSARLYDSSRRRFFSPDQAGGLTSPYSYVGNNPLSNIDPSGNAAMPFNITSYAKPGKYTITAGEPASEGMTVSDTIKQMIFRMRRNLGELTPIPRQDMSVAAWLYNGPSWIYLPYIKVSPTELLTAAYHFLILPPLSIAAGAIRDPISLVTSPVALTVYNAMKSTMYATVYNTMPGHRPRLLWLFAKKLVLHTGATGIRWGRNLLKEGYKFFALNNEARDFRSDLRADPWIKNSYRHAYWMCRYTQEWGESFALDTGYAHEYAQLDLTIEGPFDSVIDKINNLRGAKLGLIAGGNCSVLVNAAGSAQALAWAKSYEIHPITGLHLPTEFNLQGPLNMLWKDYQELPILNWYDLNALALLNVTLPGE